jgi:dethiobiotin synthetase
MRVVMLGTGTDVGKTYVTRRLAEALRARCGVLALKPVESGVVAERRSDAESIAAGAGHEAHFSPWRFARAVSPHLAAREAGHTLAVDEIVDWTLARERAHGSHVTLVETAGGALSPLAPGVTNLHLAVALEPAIWILVAPDALGVLHDVTATLRALPRVPDAVVLSAARPADASTGSNAQELATLGITRVSSVITRDGDAQPLAEWLLQSVTQF